MSRAWLGPFHPANLSVGGVLLLCRSVRDGVAGAITEGARVEAWLGARGQIGGGRGENGCDGGGRRRVVEARRRGRGLLLRAELVCGRSERSAFVRAGVSCCVGVSRSPPLRSGLFRMHRRSDVSTGCWQTEELGGGFARGFEFAGEERRGGVAGFGAVLGDGLEAGERDAACFGGDEGGAAFGEADDGVESGRDAGAVEEVDELGEGDRALIGDGQQVEFALNEESEDLGLGFGMELVVHERQYRARRGRCKRECAQGQVCARAAWRKGAIEPESWGLDRGFGAAGDHSSPGCTPALCSIACTSLVTCLTSAIVWLFS